MAPGKGAARIKYSAGGNYPSAPPIHPLPPVTRPMALVILRCVFILVAAGVGFQIIQADTLPKEPYVPWLVVGGLILLAATVIAIDVFAGRKRLDTITAVYFGLIIGLFLTYVLTIALSPWLAPDKPKDTNWAPWTTLILGMVLCYTCISILMQ